MIKNKSQRVRAKAKAKKTTVARSEEELETTKLNLIEATQREKAEESAGYQRELDAGRRQLEHDRAREQEKFND